ELLCGRCRSRAVVRAGGRVRHQPAGGRRHQRNLVSANAARAVSHRRETGAHTPRNDALKDRLSRYREIKITVTGRNSGRSISFPVWFVYEDEKVYLLPGYGSQTQWYKNVLKNPSIRVNARGTEAEFKCRSCHRPQAGVAGNRKVPGEVRGGRREALLESQR